MNKAVKTVRTLKEIKDNPINFVVDLILVAILSIIIPVPIAEQIVKRYKKQILLAVGSIFFLLTAFICFLLWFLFQTGGLSGINKNGLQGNGLGNLTGYIEAGLTNADIPSRNPLGGNGMTNNVITMDYHDPRYTFFNGVHTGIDLIPSNAYYTTNKAYKLTGQLVVFATMNGKATFAVDQYGANYVDIYNSENTMMTRYVHLATSFISTGQQVQAGQPIGVMGATGEATGVHLHYELQVNQNGTFITVDPKKYIQ